MRSSILSAAAILLILTPLVFAGNVYHVNASIGNDANPGGETSPWRTIQKAANTMSPGDTVIVHAGTYNDRVNITKSGNSGSLINWINP